VTEAAFFLVGVLPYWYTIALPDKGRRYWLVLCWCCVVWLVYFVHHGRTAPAVNNAVELILALVGLRRASGRQAPR
jgi:uncharacterized membrane protein